MAIRKKPRRSAAPAATSKSRVTILLEDIQGKVQATMEAVTGFRGEFRSQIETLRAELSRRIDVLELAVQQNSADIRTLREDSRDMRVQIDGMRVQIDDMRVQVDDTRRDIAIIKEEIRSVREVLERKPDHEALLKLEARVQVLERRLGIQ